MKDTTRDEFIEKVYTALSEISRMLDQQQAVYTNITKLSTTSQLTHSLEAVFEPPRLNNINSATISALYENAQNATTQIQLKTSSLLEEINQKFPEVILNKKKNFPLPLLKEELEMEKEKEKEKDKKGSFISSIKSKLQKPPQKYFTLPRKNKSKSGTSRAGSNLKKQDCEAIFQASDNKRDSQEILVNLTEEDLSIPVEMDQRNMKKVQNFFGDVPANANPLCASSQIDVKVSSDDAIYGITNSPTGLRKSQSYYI